MTSSSRCVVSDLACSGSLAILMPTLLQVLRHVDNLRSAVAKNALLTIIDMFTGLGQLMDPELGPVMPVLLKSASSGNQFLIASAEAALRLVQVGNNNNQVTEMLGKMGAEFKCAQPSAV